MAKKKWYAILTNLFSKPHTRNHTNSRTTTRSPSRTVNRTTSRTTMRTPTRTVTHTTSRTTSRTTVHSNPSTMNRTRKRSTQKTYSQTKSNLKSVHKRHATRNSAVKKKRYNLNKLKPKGTILYKEDFKCIFCFQLPKLPADNHRGIVLCPNCKHPAHADEFKEWTHDSPLCSRCDASIPPSFRRNPVIISVKQYVEVINEYKRRRR